MMPPQDQDSTLYSPDAALEFFKLFGKSESAKQGETIFAPGQKLSFLSLQADKMYLLAAGKVNIKTASGNSEDIAAGELFGELTPFPARSATAIAETPCQLMTLSEKQLLAGLKSRPEFVLMLMGVFVKNLRKTEPETKASSPVLTGNENSKKDSVLNAKMLQELVRKLGDTAVMNVPQQRVVFKAGGSALLMYVILEGYMTTQVADKVVGRSGPGDVIGEIALVDQKPRTASVVAETRCSLLAINRQTLLELIQTLPTFGIALLRVLASRSCLRSTVNLTDTPEDDWDW